MKIIGVIPARYDSTRFPGKPLVDIKGKSMIKRVYEQALKSKLINKVIVATDDKRIFDHVKSFGGEPIMTLKKHKSGTDRINEVVKKLNCDLVVNIQGDEPFIDPENIDKAIKPFLSEKGFNVSTLAVKIKNMTELSDPNTVKVIFDINEFALYFSRGIIPYDKEMMLTFKLKMSNKNFYKHIGLYVFRKTFLKKFSEMKKSQLEESEKLEQLRILENGEKIKIVLTNKDSVSIDTPEDLLSLIGIKGIKTTGHLL